MFRTLLARLKSLSGGGDQSTRVSVLLPFFIISLGLGALAWRSYVLSARMERGAKTVAVQYSGYAAEITARRVDAAVRAELGRLSDEWQQTERKIGAPTLNALREWVGRHDWLVSAIYVPDADPERSLYVSELGESERKGDHLTREFFTASGTIRYAWDARRLLAAPAVHAAIVQRPLAAGVSAFQQHAEVSVVQGHTAGLTEYPDRFEVVVPLSAPLEAFGIRAVVRTEWASRSGWWNQRVVSMSVSLLALVLMGLGAMLALRGLRKEAETTMLRGALIANVSHELRTPLSMIRLGAETLKRGKLTDKERKEIEDQVLREVLLLSHLVENVLDVARIQNRSTRALAFTPVRPSDLIRNLLATYDSWIRSKGFTCEMELDEAIGAQMWDRDAVSRALLNLIDNAIKYSGDTKAIEVVLRNTAEHVVIEVRDHGLGIAADDLNKIFDPYYRARFSDTITRRGAGLGLTLVQQIVLSHGGRVEVDSAPGVGTTFRLLFPASLTGERAQGDGLAATGNAI